MNDVSPHAGLPRSFEGDRADSVFSDMAEHSFPIARARAPESTFGDLRTISFARPALCTDRHQESEAEALWLLQTHTRGGAPNEDAVFTVLLAHRSGGDA